MIVGEHRISDAKVRLEDLNSAGLRPLRVVKLGSDLPQTDSAGAWRIAFRAAKPIA